MTLPNFLIIGAAKSGTTALHSYLRQHPDIYMPEKKELSYFSHSITVPNIPRLYLEEEIRSFDEYESYFSHATKEKAVGEASPMYLYNKIASVRIKSLIPQCKIIVILRNPIDRAYSAYLHAVRDWREPAKDFYEALDLEPKRIKEGWSILYHYVNAGLYSQQLERYYSSFPSENIRVFLFEDLLSNPIMLFKDIFSLLGVDPNFEPDMTNHPNVSGTIKSRSYHSFMERLFVNDNPIKAISRVLVPKKIRQAAMLSLRSINMEKQKIPDEYRQTLSVKFAEEIYSLQRLIGRDLSEWRN